LAFLLDPIIDMDERVPAVVCGEPGLVGCLEAVIELLDDARAHVACLPVKLGKCAQGPATELALEHRLRQFARHRRSVLHETLVDTWVRMMITALADPAPK
jgi:hypothetical protein